MELKEIQTEEELLRVVAGLFNEIGPAMDEIDEVLFSAGYDPDEVAARMRAFVGRALASVPRCPKCGETMTRARVALEDGWLVCWLCRCE